MDYKLTGSLTYVCDVFVCVYSIHMGNLISSQVVFNRGFHCGFTRTPDRWSIETEWVLTKRFQTTFQNFQKLLGWGSVGTQCLVCVEQSWKVRGKYMCCHSNVPLCLFYAVFKMKDAWHHTCSLAILASFYLLSFFLSTLSTVQNCCCEMLLWRFTTCLTTGRAMLTPRESVTPSPPSSSSRLWVHAAAVHIWQAPFLLTVK